MQKKHLYSMQLATASSTQCLIELDCYVTYGDIKEDTFHDINY